MWYLERTYGIMWKPFLCPSGSIIKQVIYRTEKYDILYWEIGNSISTIHNRDEKREK
jgi:hypothetical protein